MDGWTGEWVGWYPGSVTVQGDSPGNGWVGGWEWASLFNVTAMEHDDDDDGIWVCLQASKGLRAMLFKMRARSFKCGLGVAILTGLLAESMGRLTTMSRFFNCQRWLTTLLSAADSTCKANLLFPRLS